MRPLLVHVIDDDDAVRDALALLMRSAQVPSRVHRSAQAFLEAVGDGTVSLDDLGCLVLDVRMPGMDGLELQRRLVERGIDVPIVFITGHGDVPMSAAAFRTGAFDFLEKPVEGERLLASVLAALERAAGKREARDNRAELERRLDKLSVREREVMEHVIAGQSSKEIARELGVSHRTIEAHRARIMRKTGASSLPALVEMGVACGVHPARR